jgi:Flp pilus assembly protein TadD
MKKNLLLVVTLVLAGSLFAQEYKIFYSGATQGVVTVTKNANGRITIIPQVTDGFYIPPGVCPILPEYETGIYFSVFTKDIIIDGDTEIWTDSENGSWSKTVFDGNTTRMTRSDGSWAKTVVDGNTTTMTTSYGFWEKTVVDGNTATMTDSYGQWETTVVSGNTTTVSRSNGDRKKIVVDGNTTTTFYSGSQFSPDWWSKIVVVDRQGYNIYIEYTTPESLRVSGNAYYDQKDYDRAIADFTEALVMQPEYALTYYDRAKAYYAKKDYDRAIADYTQAIRLSPNWTNAYVSRGNAYLMKGDRARARADWSKALELNPNSTAARNNLENFK